MTSGGPFQPKRPHDSALLWPDPCSEFRRVRRDKARPSILSSSVLNRSSETAAIVQSTNGRKGRWGATSASNPLTKELRSDKFLNLFISIILWFLKACFYMPQNILCNSANRTLQTFIKQLFQRQFQLEGTKNRDAITLESPVLKTGPMFHVLLKHL